MKSNKSHCKVLLCPKGTSKYQFRSKVARRRFSTLWNIYYIPAFINIKSCFWRTLYLVLSWRPYAKYLESGDICSYPWQNWQRHSASWLVSPIQHYYVVHISQIFCLERVKSIFLNHYWALSIFHNEVCQCQLIWNAFFKINRKLFEWNITISNFCNFSFY